MNRLSLNFLLLGAAMLVGGVGLAIYMAIAHDFTLAPVHAHANLVGFVSLSLFGIVYRLYPELAERPLAKIHFALAAPSAIAFPPGIALAMLAEQPVVAIAASLIWFAGVILFFVQLAGLAWSRSAPAATLAAAE